MKYKEILIMSIFIKTNFDLCTGCGICQLACSMSQSKEHTKEDGSALGYNPRLSRLRIIHKRENLYHKPVVCNQCENAYCMNVCPAKAYERDDTGTVLINIEKCVGCGICVKYCPEELIYVCAETKKAVKCNMCHGDPACVKACPTGALKLARTMETTELSLLEEHGATDSVGKNGSGGTAANEDRNSDDGREESSGEIGKSDAGEKEEISHE